MLLTEDTAVKIATTHTKNPALGWDVDTTVIAENAEKIRHVHIEINASPASDEDVPSTSSFHQTVVQKGQYPGQNKLLVKVLDADGNETSAEDEWQ
jgi:hypothetical protein